jgi:hypothetical protein
MKKALHIVVTRRTCDYSANNSAENYLRKLWLHPKSPGGTAAPNEPETAMTIPRYAVLRFSL